MESTAHNKYIQILRLRIARLRDFYQQQLELGIRVHELSNTEYQLSSLENKFVEAMSKSNISEQ